MRLRIHPRSQGRIDVTCIPLTELTLQPTQTAERRARYKVSVRKASIPEKEPVPVNPISPTTNSIAPLWQRIRQGRFKTSQKELQICRRLRQPTNRLCPADLSTMARMSVDIDRPWQQFVPRLGLVNANCGSTAAPRHEPEQAIKRAYAEPRLSENSMGIRTNARRGAPSST